MKRNLGRTAGVAVAAILATIGLRPAWAATTGMQVTEGPGRTVIVSWHVGDNTIFFYDVEARQTSKLDVKFPPQFAAFSPSGRYICVDEGGGSGHLVVLEVVTKRTAIRLHGTATSSYYCQTFDQTGADPSQPPDALASSAVLIEHVVTSGPPSCGNTWTAEKVTDFFLDPRPKTAKVVRQFTWTDTAC